MSYTFDQALAFLHAMTTSPKMKAHLEGAIGYGKLPSPEEFDKSTDAQIRDNAEELLSYLDEIIGVLKDVSGKRPRQGTIGMLVPEPVERPARKPRKSVDGA
jgi:hypothetical protein